jgi:4-amino-4-deoxy-L-arabinose transferase-like glycosyltransferase
VLESYWFRALGDQWWVERLYSCATVLPTALLIVLIWRQLFPQPSPLRSFAWLAVAMWVLMPAWSWIYRNNYLENTLTAFALLSVYALLRAMTCCGSRPGWATLGWMVLGSAAMTAAVLTKGPVGLFPLVTPFIYQLTMPASNWRRSLLVQGTLVVLLAVMIGLVLCEQAPREFFATYLRQQVFRSMQGQREINPSSLGRLSLLTGLLRDFWFTGGITLLLVLLARKQLGPAVADGARGPLRFTLAMALAASLPIMVSPKLFAYYTAPSWPLFSLALACRSSTAVAVLCDRARSLAAFGRWQVLVFRSSIAATALCIALTPLCAGWYLRDRELLADVDRIAEIAGTHAHIDIGTNLAKHWALHAYLFRRHYISLEQHCATAAFHLDMPQTAGGARSSDRAGVVELTGFVLSRRETETVARAADE